MSDRLFVTLWLRNGFRRDDVEIRSYAHHENPPHIEHDGITYEFIGRIKITDFWWCEDEGRPLPTDDPDGGCAVYFEVKEAL